MPLRPSPVARTVICVHICLIRIPQLLIAVLHQAPVLSPPEWAGAPLVPVLIPVLLWVCAVGLIAPAVQLERVYGGAFFNAVYAGISTFHVEKNGSFLSGSWIGPDC